MRKVHEFNKVFNRGELGVKVLSSFKGNARIGQAVVCTVQNRFFTRRTDRRSVLALQLLQF